MKYIITKLNANNNKSLLDFYAKPLSSKGNISLILDYSPDIWNALKVEGNSSEILLVEDKQENKIAGLVILNQKLCYFHGEKTNVGYVSGLKISEEYQGTIVIALLFSGFNDYCKENNLKIWFHSVFNDNEKGLRLFGKTNKQLPIFEPIDKLKTYIFKKRLFSIKDKKNDIKISQATEADIDSIIEFISKQGQSRALLPVYSKEELLRGKGLLNGFSIKELAIARSGDSIIGLMGMWNQTAFRRWKVMGYSKIIKRLQALLNFGLKMLNYPILPAINSNIEYKILNLIIINDNNKDAFKLLFNFLMKKDNSQNGTYSISLKADNSLNDFFDKKSIAFANTIYKTYWKADEEIANKLNTNNLYIEQGGL